MRHGSLFSGIGGFDLAAEWMGWENIFHCEINDFGQKILKHYWPGAISYTDITKTDFSIHRGDIDIVTGGFPCQPFSAAGKRKGNEDDRHLWPEMLRAIREIQPRWIVGENVLGLLNWSNGLVFHEVQADLEAAGYVMFPYVLPACSKNAPHRRDRVWIVAYSESNGYRGINKQWQNNGNEERNIYKCEEQRRDEVRSHVNGFGKERITTDTNLSRCEGEREQCLSERKSRISSNGRKWNVADTDNEGLQGRSEINGWEKHYSKGAGNGIGIGTSSKNYEQSVRGDFFNFPTQSPLCSRDDGISTGLSGITVSKHRVESIKAYGNSIVPQVVYEIFKAIEQFELNHD